MDKITHARRWQGGDQTQAGQEGEELGEVEPVHIDVVGG